MGGTPIIQYNQGDDGSTKSPSPPGPKIILDMVYYEPLYSGLGKCPMGILNITFRGLYRANSVVVNWSYPLVNVYVTNWKDPPFSSWVNPLFLWPLSIAMLVYQRVNVVFLDIFWTSLKHISVEDYIPNIWVMWKIRTFTNPRYSTISPLNHHCWLVLSPVYPHYSIIND